jgi:hypothetical protein
MNTLTPVVDYEGHYSITFEGKIWSYKTEKWLKPAKGRVN